MLEHKINTESLVKLTQKELSQLSEGTLIYVQHPTKGIVGVNMDCVYIETVELTKEENSR